MNRFKDLLENDLVPTPTLKESKEVKIQVKNPFADYSEKGDLADAYAKRDLPKVEELAKKAFKKYKTISNLKVKFQKNTRKESIFTVTATVE